MRRIFTIIAALLLLIVGVILGSNPNITIAGYHLSDIPNIIMQNTTQNTTPAVAAQQAQPEDQVTSAQTAAQPSDSGDVTAEAYVKPIKHAALGMQASGIVEEVFVAEGDYVEEGQTLLRLDALQLQANLIQAEATLNKAVAALADLKAGSRAEEIAAARAVVESHQARLQQLTEQPRNEDAIAAQAALQAAQSVVADLLDGPEEELLIIAKRERDNAQAALQVAQSAYNEVKWATDIARRPESVNLHMATNTFEAAEANYQEVAKGADAAELANAYAQVEAAKSRLAHVEIPARESEISLVEAQIRNAQSQLDLLIAGPRAQTVMVAEVDVEIAQASVQQIEAALADTELKAPFAGVIASLDVEVGEAVAAGAVVLQLGDTTGWEIETDDLIDLDVVKIAEGSRASVFVDALPDVEITGTVTRIKQFGETKFGDMTYTVFIEPDQNDERLRWNMTAEVIIESTY